MSYTLTKMRAEEANRQPLGGPEDQNGPITFQRGIAPDPTNADRFIDASTVGNILRAQEPPLDEGNPFNAMSNAAMGANEIPTETGSVRSKTSIVDRAYKEIEDFDRKMELQASGFDPKR